jgi:hypothetical protein
MTADLAHERRANARISRGDTSSMEAYVTGSLTAYRRMTFWTWVGGTVSLGAASLVFRPNQLNLALEASDEGSLADAEPFGIEIPLAAITGADVTSGPFRRIHVVTARGTLSLRCSGAQEVAAAIQARIPAGPTRRLA